MANGFTASADKHHYASGMILITVGAFGVIGAITGRLAAMLAALWSPSSLNTVPTASGGGGVGGVVSGVLGTGAYANSYTPQATAGLPDPGATVPAGGNLPGIGTNNTGSPVSNFPTNTSSY